MDSNPNSSLLTPNQREHLINKYRNLLKTSRPFLKKGDIAFIRKAFDLAFSASRHKKTLLDEPGIYYPLDLTEILATEAGLGTTSLICTLLLDAYLDERIDDKVVIQHFDKQVLGILKGIQRINSIKTGKTAIQAENFIQFLISVSGDVRTLLIKMADSLYHMRIINYLDKASQQKQANDACYLFAPIAHRLGLYHIKTELEENAMRYLHPQVYHSISKKLEETTRSREDYIEAFIKPIQKELTRQGIVAEIRSRTKSIHSTWKKIEKQKVSFEEVFDLLAIRIVLDTPGDKEKEDCWRVYSIVTDIYPPNPTRLRDWISAPKTSGYESLHTTVHGPDNKWVEVQIRTKRMDYIAEMGHAAHWKYKESKTTDDPGNWLSSLRDLLENRNPALMDQQSGIHPQTRIIYVFTPGGDLKSLPSGSTVLDFAFDIHTSLGFQCTGAKVNGKICPIKHCLQNGDEVEVITAKNQKPKADWLHFLKTPRAKSKVKRALKEEEMKEAELGKEALMRKFKNWKIQFSDENILLVLKALKYKTPIDLYQAIALEKLDVLKIKEIFAPPAKIEPPVIVENDAKEADRREPHKKDDFVFLEQNLAGINYNLASCCNPIFGDDVFGFVTISKGITIHRKSCPNAEELMRKFDYRIIQVKWRESPTTTTFLTTIKISGIDDLGIVSTLSDLISNEMKVNMRSISVESNKGVFEGTIQLLVSDTRHLDMLIHKIARVKGILKASRID